MNATTMKIAAAATAPMPMYIHASLVMPRNVIGSDFPRYPLKGPKCYSEP
jgi:hypothetical protein